MRVVIRASVAASIRRACGVRPGTPVIVTDGKQPPRVTSHGTITVGLGWLRQNHGEAAIFNLDDPASQLAAVVDRGFLEQYPVVSDGAQQAAAGKNIACEFFDEAKRFWQQSYIIPIADGKAIYAGYHPRVFTVVPRRLTSVGEVTIDPCLLLARWPDLRDICDAYVNREWYALGLPKGVGRTVKYAYRLTDGRILAICDWTQTLAAWVWDGKEWVPSLEERYETPLGTIEMNGWTPVFSRPAMTRVPRAIALADPLLIALWDAGD